MTAKHEAQETLDWLLAVSRLALQLLGCGFCPRAHAGYVQRVLVKWTSLFTTCGPSKPKVPGALKWFISGLWRGEIGLAFHDVTGGALLVVVLREERGFRRLRHPLSRSPR